jgi:hypothetical protein
MRPRFASEAEAKFRIAGHSGAWATINFRHTDQLLGTHANRVTEARMVWETSNSGSDNVECFSAIDSRRALTRCS